jgi:hypothetical protein
MMVKASGNIEFIDTVTEMLLKAEGFGERGGTSSKWRNFAEVTTETSRRN